MDNYEATSQKDWGVIKNAGGSLGLEDSRKEADTDNGDFVVCEECRLCIGKLCSECSLVMWKAYTVF